MKTQVKERPIIFSGEMVRAILDGRKIQTRRVVKPQPELHNGRMVWCPPGSKYHEQMGQWLPSCVWNPDLPVMDTGAAGIVKWCPFQPGMRLWVREKWRLGDWMHDERIQRNPDISKITEYQMHLHYAAEEPEQRDAGWRPSIHMPSWASRITLEVTDVWCERLWDMDGFDCVAEGADVEVDHAAPKFIALWDAINGKRDGGIYSWDMNPWVWAVSFKRLENSNV